MLTLMKSYPICHINRFLFSEMMPNNSKGIECIDPQWGAIINPRQEAQTNASGHSVCLCLFCCQWFNGEGLTSRQERHSLPTGNDSWVSQNTTVQPCVWGWCQRPRNSSVTPQIGTSTLCLSTANEGDAKTPVHFPWPNKIHHVDNTKQ